MSLLEKIRKKMSGIIFYKYQTQYPTKNGNFIPATKEVFIVGKQVPQNVEPNGPWKTHQHSGTQETGTLYSRTPRCVINEKGETMSLVVECDKDLKQIWGSHIAIFYKPPQEA